MSGQELLYVYRRYLAFAQKKYAAKGADKAELGQLLRKLEALALQIAPYASKFDVIEGWLLSGCLAYSLGDLDKSLELNRKILHVEPGFVEAMSNMAATLRAQDRAPEAEAYWLQAIRLRPSYWDAVEHLVSLLCAQNRHGDAVAVLDFVQQAGTALVSSYDISRYLGLVYAKGNLLYAVDDHLGAAHAFAAVLQAVTRIDADMDGLLAYFRATLESAGRPPLLTPAQAQTCVADVFEPVGNLPPLRAVAGDAHKAAIVLTTSNALLTLAKILQDGMASASKVVKLHGKVPTPFDILPLYYLSLSLHASPSTANNIGILLASLSSAAASFSYEQALALEYYRYGLSLDAEHPHLYTNLGSLLKDQGRLNEAVAMYEKAVACDPTFDIALANLANAVKDQGRVAVAIEYYRRAVAANPKFDEASCGLANALNSACDWTGRGAAPSETAGVDAAGALCPTATPGWIETILATVRRQLTDAQRWGAGIVRQCRPQIEADLEAACGGWTPAERAVWTRELDDAAGGLDEGAKLVELIETAARRAKWRWYRDLYVAPAAARPEAYPQPRVPNELPMPPAPTVLPFHTFTFPFNARQIREISRRTALRVSVATRRAGWLPAHVYPPPAPPAPVLRVGYVSSDFNNHPLAHLMQSVFGMHDRARVHAICYATTPADGSRYRGKIEKEAAQFHDASGWSNERLVQQIVDDGVHILANLNGFTKGARNEIFACRPAPVSIAFMGFAGTMGAEWSDYLLGDAITVPETTVRRYRPDGGPAERVLRYHGCANDDDWVYYEDIVYCRHSFFCCDQRQTAPDVTLDPGYYATEDGLWRYELLRRWSLRKKLFPQLADDTVILANFNQLYKLDPAIFRSWLQILARVPNAVLWLLKFPELGQHHLMAFAAAWAGPDVAARILFTDVALKDDHLLRARVPDLFLDTPECNAHTTASDVLWSGTPILTYPRHDHKMCSRIAASIVASSVPPGDDRRRQRVVHQLVVASEAEYEAAAVRLISGDPAAVNGRVDDCGQLAADPGDLLGLRRLFFVGRTSNPMFDTRRWVADLERAYARVWEKWVAHGGDAIYHVAAQPDDPAPHRPDYGRNNIYL
ncbi:glycosyl transferase family 41-domain-containing protein [Dipodascopsis tothii]|uniref:glycosyl transferase family 41-domain-containing protein n=1 Tax=Dipodascopsis tothii TaxID=44089 RepID=UPI0034CF0A61